MYLIDVKIDPTTPVNRIITQEEWAKIFPGQVPRRVYWTFARGKPVEIEDEKVAKFLMKKYKTIRMTTMEIGKVIAGIYDLNYNQLKAYALRYGWSLKEVSVSKKNLLSAVILKLRNYELPMNDEEYAEFKEIRKAESVEIAKAEKERHDHILEIKALEEKEAEEKLAIAEEEARKAREVIDKQQAKVAKQKEKADKAAEILKRKGKKAAEKIKADEEKAIEEQKINDEIASKKAEEIRKTHASATKRRNKTRADADGKRTEKYLADERKKQKSDEDNKD